MRHPYVPLVLKRFLKFSMGLAYGVYCLLEMNFSSLVTGLVYFLTLPCAILLTIFKYACVQKKAKTLTYMQHT